jgi:hypothetical protein
MVELKKLADELKNTHNIDLLLDNQNPDSVAMQRGEDVLYMHTEGFSALHGGVILFTEEADPIKYTANVIADNFQEFLEANQTEEK